MDPRGISLKCQGSMQPELINYITIVNVGKVVFVNSFGFSLRFFFCRTYVLCDRLKIAFYYHRRKIAGSRQ